MTPEPVEGAQVVAQQMLVSLGPGTEVVSAAGRPAAPGWRPLLREGPFPVRVLRCLRGLSPELVVWLPVGGLNYSVVLRTFLFHLACPRAHVRLVVLQSYREPRRWMAWVLGSFTTMVAANSTQAESFTAAALRTELLEAFVPPDRVSLLDRPRARALLGISEDVAVYLHVGHATSGRNLRALQRLASDGLLLLVMSPYSELDLTTLPQGPGLRVVHERVDVGDYYRAADVYVFPTVDPASAIGMPMSVVEARANGLAVVARRSVMTDRWQDDPGVTLVDTDEQLVRQARLAAERSPA